MITESVCKAEEALNRARQTLGEVTAEQEAAAEQHEAAKQSLKTAIGAHLMDRKDPKIAAQLKEAQAAESEARRALDHAGLTVEAARENVAKAEAHLRAMIHREGSDIIMETGRALVSLSQDIDREFAALIAKIGEASALAERMENAADVKLEHRETAPSAWRREVTRIMSHTLTNLGTQAKREPTAAATLYARHRYNFVRSHPFYTPTTPDPELSQPVKEAT